MSVLLPKSEAKLPRYEELIVFTCDTCHKMKKLLPIKYVEIYPYCKIEDYHILCLQCYDKVLKQDKNRYSYYEEFSPTQCHNCGKHSPHKYKTVEYITFDAYSKGERSSIQFLCRKCYNRLQKGELNVSTTP